MNVRKKAILTITAVFLVSLIAILFTSQTIILASFQSLEKKDTETQVGRATDALNRRVLDLDTFTNSYGGWDDTYKFITDNNTAYIQSNTNNQTLDAAKLNLMVFVNSSGTIIYSTTYDLSGINESSVNSDLTDMLSSNNALWNFSNTQDGMKGLVSIAGKLFLISSRPILTSQFTGPIRGAVLMAEEIGDDFVSTLQDQTHLSIQIVSLSDKNIPLSFQEARANLQVANSIYINPVNSSLVSAFTFLNDVNGTPIGFLGVNLQRSIYQAGTRHCHHIYYTNYYFIHHFWFSNYSFSRSRTSFTNQQTHWPCI